MKNLLLKIKARVQEVSRKKKLDFFFSLAKENEKILDVGVFPETKYPNAPESVNYFLKNFKYNHENYCGLGIEDMANMSTLYPGIKFIEYDGATFPFKDKDFDWIHCNAVIEHVGEYKDQLLFIKEMIRTSKKIFFTTPNKFFILDSHTMVFFIHWNDNLFYKWRKKHNDWVPKSSLNLISKSTLKKLLNEANATKYKIITNRLFGLPMTFTVLVE